MAGRYKAYPDYKDSGVEWLGEIPSGWTIAPIKRISGIYNGATPKSAVSAYWDGDIPWVTPADMGKTNTPYIGRGARSISRLGYDSCGTTLVPADSVILSARAPIGTLGVALNKLCTNQGCKSLVTERNYDSVFLYYILASSTEQLNLLGRGTTFLELSADELGAYKTSVPPLPEQKQIAQFLDHETGKIDLLIEKQQALIALLKEKRQAVISHAVTKGLNPHATMKDSGVEWLGQVPEHWELLKIAHSFPYVASGTTPKTDSEAYYGGKHLWVTTGELREGIIVDTKKKLTNKALRDLPTLRLHPAGSVAIAMYGATIGRLGIFGKAATTNQACCVMPPSRTIYNKYLFYWLFAMRNEIINLSSGGGQPNVNQEKISSLKISAPSIAEQTQIAEFLDLEMAKLDALGLKAESAIGLMQERRTALISAAVTGKIDVRDWEPAPEA